VMGELGDQHVDAQRRHADVGRAIRGHGAGFVQLRAYALV
jgi:hypothetical protein